ncbi:MAG: hypothetical protein IJY19_01265 [Ruminococcus sp.]|nr:hypothetical protein [Ruminococcus sp.]
MKKIRTMAVLFAVIAAVSTQGCSGKKTSPAEGNIASETTISPKSIAFEWQEPYRSKLEEFRKSENYSESVGISGSMFDLCDLNSDGIPELIISSEKDNVSYCEIFTFSEGNVIRIGENGDSKEFRFYPETGIISNEHEGNGFVIGEYRTISDNSLQTEISYYNNSASASMGAVITYEINREEVSFSEYEEALAEYDSFPHLDIGRKYTFGSDSIEYALFCSESWGAVMSSAQKKAYQAKLSEIAGTSGSEAAFELFDLDGDDNAELIVSNSVDGENSCRIFSYSDGELSELEGVDNDFLLVAINEEKRTVLFANTESTDSFTDNSRSGSFIQCGRKYILNDEYIVSAFQ